MDLFCCMSTQILVIWAKMLLMDVGWRWYGWMS